MALPLAAAIPIATGVVGGLYGYNRAGRITPGEREAQRLSNLAGSYNEMLMNPDDPRFKSMVNAESQGIRRGFLQNLRDLIEANRRQALMGRQQFFDPERRDESMFSAVNKAGQEARSQARGNVLDRINQAIQNIQNQRQGALQDAFMQQSRRGQQTQAVLGGLGALNSIGGLFGGK